MKLGSSNPHFVLSLLILAVSLAFTEGAVTCGDAPAAPANGQRSGSSTTVGSTVTYTCNHGYSFSTRGLSTLTLTCMVDGRWNGTTPQCYASCTKPCQNGGTCTAPDTCTCGVGWTGMQCETALRVPSQVTGLSLSKTMSLGSPALRVTWTAPQSELPITRYKVQYKTSRDISWGSEYTISGSPPLTSIILRRLDASTEYNVRVRAVSADGDGMWSVVLTERTYGNITCKSNIEDLPDKPTNGQRNISGAIFGSTVTYSCNAGYKLIGSSTVTCLASGRWNTSRSAVQCIASCTRPCQNGGNCTAPDTCTCGVGWTGMQCETALRVPSQVTGLSLSKVVKLGQPALRVTWTAPQSDLTISQYKVQYKRSTDAEWGSETTISGSPPPTSIILRRLDASTEYNVRVRAVSADGAGMWSVVLTERTYETVTCGDAPPASANGQRNASGTTFGSTVTYTCNYGYSFSTQGHNRITLSCMANGRWNGTVPQCYVVSCFTNFNDVPAVPANGKRNISGATFGSTVTYSCDPGYKLIGPSTVICLANRRWNTSEDAVQCITFCAKPCQNGGTCTAPDTCTCDVGWTGMQCETALRVPSQVTGLSLSKAVRSGLPALRVTWTTSQSDLTISRYKVQYRKSRAAVWSSEFTISGSPPVTSTTLTGLDAATEYSVRVRAVSAAGTGMWSVVQTVRTHGRAPHPNIRTVHAIPVDRPGVIRVSWTAPTVPRGELPITGYHIRYKVRGVTNNDSTFMVQSSPAEVTGLVPGTEYQVFVASVNAIGTGEYCCESSAIYVRTPKATPQPTINLTKSALQNLSISWSVTSPQDVTSYIVFWLKGSAVIGKSDALNGIMFTIENLLSNTAYHVVVQANGPLGSVNSTSKVFYTTPNKVKALSLLVLPKQILQVSWEPADDAGRSPISYIVYATMTGMEFNISTFVEHPMTMTVLTGLPQYSDGTVSVWAKNPGVSSKPAASAFRMVNIVIKVTGVSAEWVDDGLTSLRVMVPETDMYSISYTAVNKSNAPKPNVLTTDSSSQVANGFRPDCFYTVFVEPVPSDSSEIVNRSVGMDAAVECNDVVAVGSFFGGLVAGVVFSILVVGIVFGVVKLRQQGKSNKSTKIKENENTYDTVDPKVSAALDDHVAMETNPAYASVL